MSSVNELLKANLISPGTQLIWKRTKSKVTHSAIINANGTISTSDGKTHKTLSGAARHLNGNKPVDGWIAWKVKVSGKSLAQLRKSIS